MTASVLFVSGVQRSGTTALANLLNTHAEIRICIERYKYLFGRDTDRNEISQRLFSKRRLLDFSDGYTNLTPERSDRFKGFYTDLEYDYEALRYVGDKVPGSHDRMGTFLECIPTAKVLFIVRDLHEVSNSWDARANNPDDAWPSSMSALQSVKHWNRCNEVILDLYRHYPANICVVDYHSFFGEHESCFEESSRILKFLKLNANRKFHKAVIRSKARFHKIVEDRPATTLETTVHEEIHTASASPDYEGVLKLSRLWSSSGSAL